MLRLLLTIVFLCFSSTTLASQNSTAAQVGNSTAQISERLDKLEKEIEFQERSIQLSIDTNDKRLADFGALATMQGTHTTWVGNVVAWVSIGITVIVALAGTLTYFSVTHRAKNEAQDAAQKWLTANGSNLETKISDLEDRVANAISKINEHELAVREKRRHATSVIEGEQNALRQAADDLMQKAASLLPANSSNAKETKLVQKASNELKRKPESEFNAKDHYIRGVSLYSKKNWQGALDSFNAAIELSSESSEEDRVRYLFSKAQALTRLDRGEEAVLIYKELDESYRSSDLPEVHEKLAEALSNRAMLRAEREDFEGAIYLIDEMEGRYSDNIGSTFAENLARGLSNKGLWLGKLGRTEEAIGTYDRLLTRYESDSSPELMKLKALSLLRKASHLTQIRDHKEAIDIYDVLIAQHANDSSIILRSYAIRGMLGKAIALRVHGNPELALQIYDDIERNYGDEENPLVRPLVARAIGLKTIALKSLNRLDEIPEILDKVIEKYSLDSVPEARLVAVNCTIEKAEILRANGNTEAEVTLYDELKKRYSKDSDRKIRTTIADSQNNCGYARLMLAKQAWSNISKRQTLLEAAKHILEEALELCSETTRPIVLGNLGYAEFLLKNSIEAEKFTRQALESGGQKLFRGQRDDARKFAISEDRQYEELLERIWAIVGSTAEPTGEA